MKALTKVAQETQKERPGFIRRNKGKILAGTALAAAGLGYANRSELRAGGEVFKNRDPNSGLRGGLKDAMRGASIARSIRKGSDKKSVVLKGTKSGLFDNVQHHNKIINRSPHLSSMWSTAPGTGGR